MLEEQRWRVVRRSRATDEVTEVIAADCSGYDSLVYGAAVHADEETVVRAERLEPKPEPVVVASRSQLRKAMRYRVVPDPEPPPAPTPEPEPPVPGPEEPVQGQLGLL